MASRKTDVLCTLTILYDSARSLFTTDVNSDSTYTCRLPFKVIPLFCTAHPLLPITLPHPRWWRFFPLARKKTNKGRFCRAKAFISNNNATDRLTASWFAIEKQENERNVRDPDVCSGFSLRGRRVVELLKCPG